MRKIDFLAASAFHNNENFRLSNTEVRVNNTHVYLLLHGNLIAEKDISKGLVWCSLAGYNTLTTKSRLRALGANIETKRGKIFANGKEIHSLQWFHL